MLKRFSSLWLFACCWSISSAAVVCPNNYVKNPSASTQGHWAVTPPDTNPNGAILSGGSFQITTTGSEIERGYFSQQINIPAGASNFTISAQMKRRETSVQGAPYILVDVANNLGVTFSTLVDATLTGMTSNWATYSASFYLPSAAYTLVVKLAVQPRVQGQVPSANVAYFDDICVTYATLEATVQNVTGIVGQQASLQCVLSGADSGTFVWTKSTSVITAERAFSFSRGSFSTLMFYSLDIIDEGQYTCNAATPAGNTSATATLLVYKAPVFQQTPQPMSVNVGADLTLPCAVDGRPSPTVNWYKDNTIITASSHSYISINTRSHELTIQAINPNRDSGIYRCSASNEVGRVSRIYHLTIPPFGGTVKPNPTDTTDEPTTVPAGTKHPTIILAITHQVVVATFRSDHTDNLKTTASSHPSDETSFWDKKILGLYIYIWVAIGGVALILFIIIIACCVTYCRRRSRKKKEKKRKERHAVHYSKGSRRAGYAVTDTARIVGPGPHMHSYPNSSFYPDGTMDSGYNSNRQSTWMQPNGYPGYDMQYVPPQMGHPPMGYPPGHQEMPRHHVPLGPRTSQGSFGLDTSQLVPRIPTEDELEEEEGQDNMNFYEELPTVQEELQYCDMSGNNRPPDSEPDSYVIMQQGVSPTTSKPTEQSSLDKGHRPQFSSMDHSNLDALPRAAIPSGQSVLPTRLTSTTQVVDIPKRLSVQNSNEDIEKRRSVEADVPDTPGDVDYRL